MIEHVHGGLCIFLNEKEAVVIKDQYGNKIELLIYKRLNLDGTLRGVNMKIVAPPQFHIKRRSLELKEGEKAKRILRRTPRKEVVFRR